MAKMLSVAVEDSFARKIDELIASSGLYSSRSEFLKDSIRKNLAGTLELSEDLKSIRKGAEQLGAKARARGYKGRLPMQKERDKLAIKFMKENGLM